MPPEMEDMADAAGAAAYEAYNVALDSGMEPSAAASVAIEAASKIMTEMGAPTEMVALMSKAAQVGFDQALSQGVSPEEAFTCAGESIDQAMEEPLPNPDEYK